VTDTQRRAAAVSLGTAGALLLAAGCASQGPALSNTVPSSATPRSSAATTAELRAMAAKYMAIAQPANRQLDHEFDGFGDHVKDGGLAAAQADLRAGLPPPDTS
jgi:hypothetical protein